MRVVNVIALILIIIGGLNWGLVGFFDYNLVDAIFGEGSGLARVIYAVVGLAAVYKLVIAIGSRTMATEKK
ncbi:MAG: DUF378 domain-containing protein [Candidatus Microsaccharimonas sp.]|jgi:uncharacterized membrane protein YuzA (DUF378 family)